MNGLNVNQQALLILVRGALWSSMEELPEADWGEVEKLAISQGVLWMLYLGAKKYPQQIPADRVRIWRGSMHAIVLNNEQINDVQVALVEWLAQNGIRAAILKGTSCSRYYPYPEARSLGDIDILVDEAHLGEVRDYLISQGYMPSQEDHEFHVAYYGKDAVIEVHSAITNVPDSLGGLAVRREMSRFLDSIEIVNINEMVFPGLSTVHHTLMLLLHMERHMVIGGIGLRQLCDWATFVNGSEREHWKNGTLALLDNCGLLIYAKALTQTCVKFLGLDPAKADWCNGVVDERTDEIIADVFRGGSMGRADTESIGNLFTDRAALGNKHQGKVWGIISYLNKLAYKNWPITQKSKILLPLCWIYIPMRYWVRSLLGDRRKLDYAQIIGVSNQRERLYKSLKLYEINERKN